VPVVCHATSVAGQRRPPPRWECNDRQVVATDRHDVDGRSSLRDGYDAIVALVGKEHARYLVDTNPALILADKEIPVAIADDHEMARDGRGGRWLGRLWGR